MESGESEKRTAFTRLFQPFIVNGVHYKNRIVSAPMAFGLIALHPEAGPRAYRKIEASARGGAAAVIVGEIDVNFTDANRLPFPAFDFTEHTGAAFDAISHFAEIIKKHGSVALIELAHGGSEKTPFPGQKNPVGPVSYTRPDGVRVDAASPEDMDRIAGDFATAARFMQAAGFDGVLIHAGHGFLFTQFLSARTNTRDDEYGGSDPENRARFPLEIFKRIRAAVGESFIIDIRLSATEGEPGGISPEETGAFCKMMEGIVDSVHLSTGLYTSPVDTHQFTSMYVPHGCNADMSAIVKRYTSLPVGVIGGINSPELAEEILTQGKADYIILGRQMIADPEFPNKALNGRENEIRRCLRCFTCFPGSPEEGYTDIPWDSEELAKRVGTCAINPKANLHFDYTTAPAPEELKKVLVIGGGAAGMQAAIICADRGHSVTMVEKENTLGGLLRFSEFDINKHDLRAFCELLVREVRLKNIKVMLNTRADGQLIEKLSPDALILAVGSCPAKPSIPGIEKAYKAIDVYFNEVIPGKSVVVVGGGLVGCEVGLHLAKTGREVTIIEMLERLADESFGMYREALVREMDKFGIASYAGARCLEITENCVRAATRDGEERVFSAETIIYALGMIPNDISEFKMAAGKIPVYTIGDCVRPAKVESAIREGYLAAMEI